ncbi:MAG: hypothetical protein J6A79_05355 [Clostridia bacterium]|nr:hypothetical protein [Clostridia bacterium]
MAYSVFPERLDKLDTGNVEGSLGALENYINYMQERVEFSLTNMYKTVQGAGVSSAEMLVLIAALSNSLSAVTAAVNQVQGTVTGLQTTVGNHTTQLAADQQALASLRTDVDAAAAQANLNATAITALQGQMADMAQDISDLNARVTALEGGE